MGVKEFDYTLREIIPAKLKDFAKIEAGERYHFDHWGDDAFGVKCIYYRFNSRGEGRPNQKRVVVSEVYRSTTSAQSAHL